MQLGLLHMYFVGVSLYDHKNMGQKHLKEPEKSDFTKLCSKHFIELNLKKKEKFYFAPEMVIIAVTRQVHLFGIRRGEFYQCECILGVTGFLKAVNKVPKHWLYPVSLTGAQ